MRKFLLTLDRIYAIPGWLALHAILSGVKAHPWKERNFSLNDWVMHRTPDMRICDMMFWIGIAGTAMTVYFHFFE